MFCAQGFLGLITKYQLQGIHVTGGKTRFTLPLHFGQVDNQGTTKLQWSYTALFKGFQAGHLTNTCSGRDFLDRLIQRETSAFSMSFS